MTPNPIPLRSDPTAVFDRVNQAVVRAVIASSRYALDRTAKPADYARRTWGSETAGAVDWLTKAPSGPAMTSQAGWARELSHVVITFLSSLLPVSAGVEVLSRGMRLDLDGIGAISLPLISRGQASFVAEGQPIPVVAFSTSAGIQLQPFKLATLTVLTREMLESSNAETIVATTLRESVAYGVDSVLFSANAATAAAPPGLLAGISPLTPSTATILSDALMVDMSTLAGAVARVAGSQVVFVMAPEQAAAAVLMTERESFPIFASLALAKGTVIAVAANALVSAFGAQPEIEARRETVAMMDSAPVPIGSTGPVASVFQSDRVALRLIMPATWGLRSAGAIAWMQNVTW